VTTHRGYDLPLDPGHFRAAREVAGLTQQDVAEWADVTDRSARRWDVTHPAPDEVARWVLDELEKVLADARALLDASTDGTVPAGETVRDRAVVTAALLFARDEGRDLRVVGP